ncbi:MAG: transposase [Chloracidobacterium sp.]|uniref:Transposase n=1 Tax=Chloracidobacterium validum TaxID=2821543 RepID=A0ABX8BC67_9BACT|nr:transposase [Chloracidobacterium validum]QUW04527.1 transposase [Chloracidobacterium validum]
MTDDLYGRPAGRPNRRSIRLQGYDYTQPGAYFVTIVARDRVCLFGEVVGGEMQLNEYGQIVCEEWFKTTALRPYVRLDENEFVVMPNHVHGIIRIVDDVGATRRVAPTTDTMDATPPGPEPGSIGAIIGQFKSVTAKRINTRRGTPGLPVWQRNYYEHIIRNEESLNRIREYIGSNPMQWELDRENPT